MDNTEMITRARELCEIASDGPWENGCGYVKDQKDVMVCNLMSTRGEFGEENNNASFIAASRTLVPQLCEALEAAQHEYKQLKKHSENLRLDYVDLLDRAEKAEAELSTLRTPKPADSIKIDAPVQIGRVRFGAGCTVWKCPCCRTFLTPTHKYCSDCGQAVSFTTPQEGE